MNFSICNTLCRERQTDRRDRHTERAREITEHWSGVHMQHKNVPHQQQTTRNSFVVYIFPQFNTGIGGACWFLPYWGPYIYRIWSVIYLSDNFGTGGLCQFRDDVIPQMHAGSIGSTDHRGLETKVKVSRCAGRPWQPPRPITAIWSRIPRQETLNLYM